MPALSAHADCAKYLSQKRITSGSSSDKHEHPYDTTQHDISQHAIMNDIYIYITCNYIRVKQKMGQLELKLFVSHI